MDNNVLIQYVEGGGNVYLMCGTGVGGGVNEAARWNSFLNHFGLSLAETYNGIIEDIGTSSSHPIFAKVDHLFQNNGQFISDLAPNDPRNEILVTYCGQGLYAIYNSPDTIPPRRSPGRCGCWVPECLL